MTHLRKMMLEELERRNYAQTTIHGYIQTIEDFARLLKATNGSKPGFNLGAALFHLKLQRDFSIG
jgi:hypothetical protein